ncbi:RDD family protein [Micromonospora sp. WMMD1102]|uniref:RDD family protein n=1 Tax=Micromonospora sp. WMMD1102 TaxID=3016105 RepID=UPI00241519EE|nr:RDD family protein [Micromonospora sp. WMMD1102]MDG4784860.1 RDD family protein [Micromonospora sp. WMMD1102]
MTAQPPKSAPGRPGYPTGYGTDAGLVSGEAVELDIRAARLGSRMLALLLDVLVQFTLAVILVTCAGILLDSLVDSAVLDRAALTGLQTVGVVLLLVGYPVACETLNSGRTLGKLAVGLRVVRADGGRVGFRQAMTRSLVGVAVEWPGLVLPLLTWAVGVTVMLTDPRGRRLGDLAAGTLVIHDRSPAGTNYLPTMVPPLAGWAATLDLTRLDDDLALAVRQLLSRTSTLTRDSRRRLTRSLWAEVAAVTSPPPPPGVPEWAYLAAVLAERHARARQRLAGTRSVAATLWPELAAPATDPPTPVRPAAPVAAVPTGAGPSTAVPTGVVATPAAHPVLSQPALVRPAAVSPAAEPERSSR